MITKINFFTKLRYCICAFFLFSSPVLLAQMLIKGVGSPFSMFSQNNLSAWEQRGNANWHIDNYLVSMDQGEGWLVSRLPLEDFIVDMEYSASDTAQVIFFVRCSDPRSITKDTAYGIVLSELSVGKNGLGSLIGGGRADASVKLRDGFNSLKVTGSQGYLTVWLNGVKTIDNLYDTRFKSGPIALRVKKGSIQIKSLDVTIPGRW